MCPFIYTYPVNAEPIAVGSEMLTPHRQDTNSLYLSGKPRSDIERGARLWHTWPE